MTRKRRWDDLPAVHRSLIIAAAAGELVVTTIAVLDISHRTAVRGGKLAWVLAFAVQPFGPVAYLLFGRSRAS